MTANGFDDPDAEYADSGLTNLPTSGREDTFYRLRVSLP
jgi:hypothetical protein